MYTIHAPKAEIVISGKFRALRRCFRLKFGTLPQWVLAFATSAGQKFTFRVGPSRMLGSSGQSGPGSCCCVGTRLTVTFAFAFFDFRLAGPSDVHSLMGFCLRLSQSLKSISVGRSMFCTTVCMDHCSRRFGGSL